jgi:hypothetical protein
MHLYGSVAIGDIPCNLLILRATNLCKQGVTGSIPVTSTIFLCPRLARKALPAPRLQSTLYLDNI